MLPAFDTNGNLPPGIHVAVWLEVVARFGYNKHRQGLLEGLQGALRIFKAAGCRVFYLDGSFVTSKELPEDYDACYELEGIDLVKLRDIEPVFFDFRNRRLAQKTKYRGEFFPAENIGGPSGQSFLSFFQRDKTTGSPKGIVSITLGSLE